MKGESKCPEIETRFGFGFFEIPQTFRNQKKLVTVHSQANNPPDSLERRSVL